MKNFGWYLIYIYIYIIHFKKLFFLHKWSCTNIHRGISLPRGSSTHNQTTFLLKINANWKYIQNSIRGAPKIFLKILDLKRVEETVVIFEKRINTDNHWKNPLDTNNRDEEKWTRSYNDYFGNLFYIW